MAGMCVSVNAATTCESLTSEKSCMSSSEGAEHCSWCSSAAAGKLCLKESDAKTLPSSVFACEYAPAYGAAATTCDSLTSEKKCMAGLEGSEHCSWCSSAAAGSLCMKESDAKTLPSSVFACEYVAAYGSAATTCESITTEKTCMASSEGSDHCSWCSSAAAGKLCLKESDAKTLPSSVFACEYAYSYKGLASSTCESFTSEKKCMAGLEGSEHCSWCSSAAAGSLCLKETDAKTLPSSVFACEYVAAYGAAASTCDSLTSEKSCMAGSESGEHCSWCSSAAAGKLCLKESDAKTLPTSVFECEYVKTFYTAATCDSYTSEKTCMSNSEGSDHCSWCSSAAAGKLCLKESDAKTLPVSVFECEYTKFNLRANM